MKLHRGFNLIELMVVITIIALLTALAIPAYQNYTIRTKLGEVFTLASAAKTNVTAFYQEIGQWPDDNAQAGLDEPEALKGHYVAAIRVDGPQISVVLGDNLSEALSGKTVVFLAEANAAGQVLWGCEGKEIEGKYLPSDCR
jgi:type IV pilus assembly protein PilA